jgi:hypothetical protein
MSEIVEIEQREKDEEKDGPSDDYNGPPIAHISPREPGPRRSLCGEPILGISPGDLPFVLCRECVRINGGDPRGGWYEAGGPF